MCKELINIKNNNGKLVVSSREVSENFGKEHSKIMRSIKSLEEGIAKSGDTLKYFILTESINNQNGQNYKEYLLTRDGFSLLVMGFTGSKALEFKLKYIEAFNKMEEYIKNNMSNPSYLIEDRIARAKAWIQEEEERRILLEEVNELSPFAKLAKERLDKTGTVSLTDMTKTYKLKRGQISTWSKIKGYIHKSHQEVNKDGEEYFKVVDYNGHKGIAIKENGIKLIDKNIEEIKNSPTRLKKSA